MTLGCGDCEVDLPGAASKEEFAGCALNSVAPEGSMRRTVAADKGL